MGITSKLALETLSWPQLVVWGAIAYAIGAVVAVATGTRVTLGAGTVAAAATGAMLVAGSALLFVALGRGDASVVVPVSSIYPAVTVLLAALFLAEAITWTRVAGLVLVLAGVGLLTR
jgi:uncharacterized membrane protein